jgi:hypothetical protein
MEVLVMKGLKYLILVTLLPVWSNVPLRAGTSEMIVADRNTGVALAGYDPVAYFASASPVQGRNDYEFQFRQGVFRFHNEGNRAAFVEHPEIYTPQFGGYDPIALARGIALPGNPLEWLIVNDRLYLFYSASARTAFLANPPEAIVVAAERWPGVARDLLP